MTWRVEIIMLPNQKPIVKILLWLGGVQPRVWALADLTYEEALDLKQRLEAEK